MWIYAVLLPSISMYIEFLLPYGNLSNWIHVPYIILSLPQLLLFRKPSPFWATTLKLFLVAEAGMALFYVLAYFNVFELRPDFVLEEIVRGFILAGGLHFMTLMLCYGLMRQVFPWLKQIFVTKSGRPA